MQSKYFAKKVTADGITFDSNHEFLRYQELIVLKNEGKIINLVVHPTFKLQDEFEKNGVKYTPINYEADFSYIVTENDEFVIEDVKGFETDEFKLHKKMFEYKYKEYALTVLKYYEKKFIKIDDFKLLQKDKVSFKKQQIKDLKAKTKELCEQHNFSFDMTSIKTTSALKTLNKQIKILTDFVKDSEKTLQKLEKLKTKKKLTDKEKEFIELNKNII